MSLGLQLLVDPSAIGGAGWFCFGCNAGTPPKRQATVATSGQKLMTQNTPINFTVDQLYEASFEASAVEISHLAFGAVEASGANTFLTWANLATGAIGSVSDTGFTDISRSIETISAGRYRVTMRFRPSASQGAGHNATLWMSNVDGGIIYTSVIGQGLNVHSASLREVLADAGGGVTSTPSCSSLIPTSFSPTNPPLLLIGG